MKQRKCPECGRQLPRNGPCPWCKLNKPAQVAVATPIPTVTETEVAQFLVQGLVESPQFIIPAGLPPGRKMAKIMRNGRPHCLDHDCDEPCPVCILNSFNISLFNDRERRRQELKKEATDQ